MKPAIDITIEICGSAGDGSIAAGQIFNHAMSHLGYHVMNFDSYPAEIRGFGKSVAHTRVSDRPLHTPGAHTDCLIALDDVHSIPHLAVLKDHGVVIYDSRPMDYHDEDQAVAGFIEPGMIGYGAPLRELSITALQTAKSRNIVALGVMAGLFGTPAEAFHYAIGKRFAGKPAALIEANIRAFDLGYDHGRGLEKADPVRLPAGETERTAGVSIVSGNEAAARACLDADIRLYAGYPITPATRIMEIMARELPKKGGAFVQTEDEIAAICHITGAGFAGSRAATATSGPGLSLMAECLNLAVMAEIPIVVIDSQRAGPSTGLPTKTEQSDLNMAVLGGTGDSPRPVLAPTTVEECYTLVLTAFEVASALQTPVIVLLDLFLSNRMEDVAWQRLSGSRFGRYHPPTLPADAAGYARYRFTDSGVSPRALPGQQGYYYVSTGLEHNEGGFPDYTAENHRRMGEKRRRKMDSLRETWPPPETTHGHDDLEVGIIAWGSTVGAAREAIDILRAGGVRAGGLFPRLLWPLHEEALRAFAGRCRRLLVVEMNESGQYAGLISRALVGRAEINTLARVHAAPFPVGDIVTAAQDLVKGESK